MSEPKLHRIAVGERYHPDRARWDAGTQYNYRAGSHELLCFMSAPRPPEVANWQRGPWEFALLVRPELLFLLYKAGAEPWCDAPYSWWRVQLLKPEEAVPPFDLPTEESRALLSAILVDANTGVVKVIKALTFSPPFSRTLHQAIRDQMAAPPSAGEYDRAVTRYDTIYRTTEDMLAASRLQNPYVAYSCRGGE